MGEYKKYLVDKSTPLSEALKALNKSGRRIVFLVDNDMLVGSLTYGDVSRWILNEKPLTAPAIDASIKNPITVSIHDDFHGKDIFADKGANVVPVNAIPVVDDDGKVVDIIFFDKEPVQYSQIDVPVVIMAGGKGTRLYPYTKILPKPLIPIGEIPISEHIINRFCKNGCRKFFFIVNYKKNMIKAYFNEMDRPYEVFFIDEEKPLGTGGGLGLMKGLISSTFILTNCDSIIDEDYSKILQQHKDHKNAVTMICSNQKFEVPYGVVDADESGELISMREKPCFSYLTNTGTYIVEPDVIDMIEPKKSIGFPDIIQMVKEAGKNVGIYIVSGRDWLDMGQFDTMEDMKKRLHVQD